MACPVFYSAELLAELDAVETALELAELQRRAGHGQLLRRVCRLHTVMIAGGDALGCAPQLALLRGCSEVVAAGLLDSALLLALLPGGLEALDCGLLGVEAAGLLTRSLRDVPADAALTVWRRVQQRLIVADARHELLPPGRLRTLVDGWIIQADPQWAVEQVEQARAGAQVGYRRRDDGLVDLYLEGLTAPNAQAVLSRIRARSQPWGAGDDRPAGQRRLEAAVDLLLGRDARAVELFDAEALLPTRPGTSGLVPDSLAPTDPADRGAHDRGVDDHDAAEASEGPSASCAPAPPCRSSSAPCGCRLGQPVPCGTDVRVLVPLGAALGTTSELAQLTGHGPLDPDTLRQLLLTDPVLRPVWVDDDGLPVAASEKALRPGRDDPEATR